MVTLAFFGSTLLGAFLCLAPVAHYVLGPINRVVANLRAPSRFQLNDFFWLLVQWQLLLGACVSFVGTRQWRFFTSLVTAGTIVVVLLWSGAVSFISRAGIDCPRRRAVFVVFLLPATLSLMVGAVATVVALITMPFAIVHDDKFTWLQYALVYAAIPLVIGLAIFLRRVSFWILSGLRIHRVAA
ncbi:MAG: hypothetical protein RIS70_3385 [Planctomycetota bacterium]|jgi:hypothetical protein